MKKDKAVEPEPEKEVTLEDVTPLHPEAYPAKHLKERLDARRDMLGDIEDRSHPTGMPNGSNL